MVQTPIPVYPLLKLGEWEPGPELYFTDMFLANLIDRKTRELDKYSGEVGWHLQAGNDDKEDAKIWVDPQFASWRDRVFFSGEVLVRFNPTPWDERDGPEVENRIRKPLIYKLTNDDPIFHTVHLGSGLWITKGVWPD